MSTHDRSICDSGTMVQIPIPFFHQRFVSTKRVTQNLLHVFGACLWKDVLLTLTANLEKSKANLFKRFFLLFRSWCLEI